MTRRDMVAFGAGTVLVGSICLGLLRGASWLLDGGAVTLLGPTVAGGVALAAVGWAVLTVRSRARYIGGARMVLHTHGNNDLEVAAWHEAGHAHMTRKVRGRVHRVEIHPDGSGVTHLTLPRNIRPHQRIAVDVAGEVGSGTKAGCASDHAYMRQALRRVPRAERAQVKAAGYDLARTTCTRAALAGTAQRLVKRRHL